MRGFVASVAVLGGSGMFQSNTVFVVGAGASADLGLPLGDALRDEISAMLGQLTIGRMGQIEGPPPIIEALRAKAAGEQDRDALSRYFVAARHIATNLPLVRSIDEFVDHHMGDQHVEFVAKLAICWLILKAESQSSLLTGEYNERVLNAQGLRKRDAWLLELWYLLRTGARADAPEQVFQNVSFIVFNYDRCVEVFLRQALTALFRTTQHDAAMIVDNLDIIHPYGRVGDPFSHAGGVGFGQVDRPNLGLLATNVKTFGESERDSEQMARIETLLNNASNVVFLGFAFHDQNMDFFESRSPDRPYPNVYATAYGLPEEHTADIRAALVRRLRRKPNSHLSFEPIFRNLKGAELLRVFDKPLRR
jgi:hypothetical protein